MELLGEYKSFLKISAFFELLDMQSVKMKSYKKDRSSLILCVTGWTIFLFFSGKPKVKAHKRKVKNIILLNTNFSLLSVCARVCVVCLGII